MVPAPPDLGLQQLRHPEVRPGIGNANNLLGQESSRTCSFGRPSMFPAQPAPDGSLLPGQGSPVIGPGPPLSRLRPGDGRPAHALRSSTSPKDGSPTGVTSTATTTFVRGSVT